jgi:hypothetical protein
VTSSLRRRTSFSYAKLMEKLYPRLKSVLITSYFLKVKLPFHWAPFNLWEEKTSPETSADTFSGTTTNNFRV